MNNKCTEWCSHCEREVELSTEMIIQQCPNCGKYIIPCSMCEWDNTNCVDILPPLKRAGFLDANA